MIGALAMLTALAWIYVLLLATRMEIPAAGTTMRGMDMTGMSAALVPAMKPWSLPEFLLTFVMWSVMMLGMMTPSAAPMILIYARVGRKAATEGIRRNSKDFAPSCFHEPERKYKL